MALTVPHQLVQANKHLVLLLLLLLFSASSSSVLLPWPSCSSSSPSTPPTLSCSYAALTRAFTTTTKTTTTISASTASTITIRADSTCATVRRNSALTPRCADRRISLTSAAGAISAPVGAARHLRRHGRHYRTRRLTLSLSRVCQPVGVFGFPLGSAVFSCPNLVVVVHFVFTPHFRVHLRWWCQHSLYGHHLHCQHYCCCRWNRWRRGLCRVAILVMSSTTTNANSSAAVRTTATTTSSIGASTTATRRGGHPSRQKRFGPAPLASFEDLPTDDQDSSPENNEPATARSQASEGSTQSYHQYQQQTVVRRVIIFALS